MGTSHELSTSFVIEGGEPVGGTFRPAGNKNEALPAIAAALLVPGRTEIGNVPRIRDVETMLAIARGLGVSVLGAGPLVAIDAEPLRSGTPDAALCREIRASILFAPALLHRTGEAVLPRPGGDRIGRRRIDTHLLALQALGAEVHTESEGYRLTLRGRFQGADLFLDEASVTATENAVMAAAVAEGATRIVNAAGEPHVQGLCHLLRAMGARIAGIGTNVLEIEGVPALGGASHQVAPDYIEIGSMMALAGMTGGRLIVEDVVPDHLRMIRMVFRRLGLETALDGTTLEVPAGQELLVQEDLHGAIPKIDDAIWPGFPADLTSIALVLATQCKGTVLIHEKLFESRLFFVDRLIAMGARVVLCDPHRAVVVGPSHLQGSTMASPDIRAGMALVAAALSAQGRSTIMNAHQVDRGYERIDERLRALGARIRREPA